MKFIEGFDKLDGSFKLEVLMNIFVLGFPYTFVRKDLIQLFESHGTVNSAKIIYNAESGQSRCFGFVEMEESEALKAIKELDGTTIGSHKLVVMKAKPKEELAAKD